MSRAPDAAQRAALAAWCAADPGPTPREGNCILNKYDPWALPESLDRRIFGVCAYRV